MSLRKKSIYGILWSFTENVGVRVLSISTYFILAKILGPSAFGLVALTNTFVFISEVFVEQGFTAAIVQKKGLSQNHLASAFWGNILTGIVLFVLLYVSASSFAKVFDEAELTKLLQLHSASFIISSFSRVHIALLQKDFNFKKIALVRIIATAISCVTSIILAYKDFGAYSIVIQQIIFNLVQSVIFPFVTNWKPNFSFSWILYKELFSFGSKVMVSRFIQTLSRNADSLFIGYFFGTNTLGFYSFAQKIFVTVSDLIDLTFTTTSFAAFSTLQDQKELLSKELAKYIEITAYASFPVFVSTILFISPAIMLVFGEKWVPSIPIVQILSVSGIIMSFYACFNSFLLGTGRANLSLKLRFFYFVVSIILIVIAVQISIEMVAVSYIFSSFIVVALMLKYVYGIIDFNVKDYAVNILQPLAACTVIAIIVTFSSHLVQKLDFLFIAMQVVAVILLYFTFLFFAKRDLVKKFR